MPTRERVQALVAQVQANRFVEAIEDFYTEDASMQENLGATRVGRATLVAHERAMLGRNQVKTLGGEFLIDGDTVIIHWRFEITDASGRHLVLEELAHQCWRGDRVAEERFYYDPGQLAGRA